MRRCMALRWHSKTFSPLFQALVLFCSLTFSSIEFYLFTVAWWDRNTCAWRRLQNMDGKPKRFFLLFLLSSLHFFLFQIVHEKFLHFMLSNLHIFTYMRPEVKKWPMASSSPCTDITNILVFFSVIENREPIFQCCSFVSFEKFDFDRWICQVLCQERTAHTHTHTLALSRV